MLVRGLLGFMMIAGIAGAQSLSFEADVETDKKPWTHLEFNNDARNFQFAIVTDRTGGHRPGVFMKGVERLNLLQPEFVVSVGDLIEGYTEDRDRLAREWDEFNGFVAQLEMPFFYVPGNHDITNAVMAEEWDKRFGRPYYHFVYGDVLFLCLNSEDPPSTQMSDEQVAYAKKTLAANEDVRWTMVFIHKPLWNYGPENNGWAEVEAALKGRRHNVYAGHTHHYSKTTRNDSAYIVMATMGGGSAMRGTNFGEFDHFMWVTMTDEGPIMANLMLDGVWDTNVITEGRMDLLRPIMSGAAVKTDGIVLDSGRLTTASTMLRLTNDADVPMNVNLSLRPPEGVHTSIQHLSQTVAPNSVELVPLEITHEHYLDPEKTEVSTSGNGTITRTMIRARQPSGIAVYDLDPVIAMWTVTYDIEGDLNPLSVRGSHRIILDSVYHAQNGKKEIDGSLSDWSGLNVQPPAPGQLRDDKDTWTGAHDGSFDFDVYHDDTTLYIGVDVTDDRVQLNRRSDYRRQDSVMVAIDPSGGLTPDSAILIPVIPDERREEDDPLPAGAITKTSRTETGYQVEVGIPLDQLFAAQNGVWWAVRVNIGMNDYDADGSSQIWWRPRWDSPEDYTGSGIFRK